MIDKREWCYTLYDYFTSQFYQQQLICKRSEKNRIILTNFLLEIHKTVSLVSVGPEYLFNYLIFQFDYWNEKNVEFGDRITLSRIFGKACVERFFNISKDYSWYNAKLTLNEKYSIESSIINDLIASTKLKDYKTIDRVEEIEKQRFFNHPAALAHCIENTTLFNHRSSVCVGCKHKKICKSTLKQMYIGIYHSRGYVR